MATQGELITQIRNMLDEDNGRMWKDSMLRRWINDGAREICRKSEAVRATATIPTLAGVGEYTIAQNVVRVTDASWKPTSDTQQYPLTYRDRHSMDNVWYMDPDREGSYPMFFTTWGAPPDLTIRLFPVPSDGGAITLLYYSYPTDLATDTEADANSRVDIPAGWDDMIVDYVEYRALRRDRDPRWQEAYQLWATKLDDLSNAATRYSDQAGQVDWNGNPHWLTMGEFY